MSVQFGWFSDQNWNFQQKKILETSNIHSIIILVTLAELVAKHSTILKNKSCVCDSVPMRACGGATEGWWPEGEEDAAAVEVGGGGCRCGEDGGGWGSARWRVIPWGEGREPRRPEGKSNNAGEWWTWWLPACGGVGKWGMGGRHSRFRLGF